MLEKLFTVVGIPIGVTNYSGIMSVPPSISPIFMQLEWHNIFTVDMVVVVLTFLFIDMFDTIGTLIGVSNRAGMVDDNGNVKNLNQAFMADAIGTTVGAMLGTFKDKDGRNNMNWATILLAVLFICRYAFL